MNYLREIRLLLINEEVIFWFNNFFIEMVNNEFFLFMYLICGDI